MNNHRIRLLSSLLFMMVLFASVGRAQEYVLVGWNDLGMHCANKDFSKVVVLPPYNNVTAQLVRKAPGSVPEIVTTGYTVEYSIPGNTYSVGKTNFWSYAQQVFGLSQPLSPNIGLTGKGLTGVLDPNGTFFKATGIPITPFADADLVHEQPYQLIHLVAKASGNGTVLATTDVVIPVSNEIGCVQSGCHSSETNILNAHEDVAGFNRSGPVLCASCHASNALGTTGNPEAKSLSYRIHEKHQWISPQNGISTCYKCHPGPNTQCLRDVMATNASNPLVCQSCHGTMANVAQTINNGRQPWLQEPQCGNSSCHGSNYAEEPGKLYRESKGHGGLFCSVCHGSPHAIFPSREPNDNLQNIRLQGYAGALRECSVCHATPPSGPGPHGILPGGLVTQQYSVNSSWNILSVPLTVTDASLGALFPTASSNAFTYVSGAGYLPEDTLLNGIGYWLKFPSAQQVSMTGVTRSADTIHVVEGWNLIGSISASMPVTSVLQVPAGIVQSSYFQFSSQGYVRSTAIDPLRAYWVKSASPGLLILRSSNGGAMHAGEVPRTAVMRRQ